MKNIIIAAIAIILASCTEQPYWAEVEEAEVAKCYLAFEPEESNEMTATTDTMAVKSLAWSLVELHIHIEGFAEALPEDLGEKLTYCIEEGDFDYATTDELLTALSVWWHDNRLGETLAEYPWMDELIELVQNTKWSKMFRR